MVDDVPMFDPDNTGIVALWLVSAFIITNVTAAIAIMVIVILQYIVCWVMMPEAKDADLKVDHAVAASGEKVDAGEPLISLAGGSEKNNDSLVRVLLGLGLCHRSTMASSLC